MRGSRSNIVDHAEQESCCGAKVPGLLDLGQDVKDSQYMNMLR